jgi:hypothetical protein
VIDQIGDLGGDLASIVPLLRFKGGILMWWLSDCYGNKKIKLELMLELKIF